MKGREFGKEAAQIFVSGARDIAGGKDRSEDQKYAAKLTQPKTDSSGCFGISPSYEQFTNIGIIPLPLQRLVGAFQLEPLYRAQDGFVNLDSARQSIKWMQWAAKGRFSCGGEFCNWLIGIYPVNKKKVTDSGAAIGDGFGSKEPS